jgi:hypothetical protein
MKYTLFLLIAMMAVNSSCKKNSQPAPPLTPVSKYMNYTAGSLWTIQLTKNASTSPVTANYTLTATSRDTLINGRSYRVYANSTGINEYYYNDGSNYYTYRNLPGGLGTQNVEILYLKDNASTGVEWSQVYDIEVSGVPIKVTLTNRVEERGLTKTVNGKAYTDVIKIKTTLAATGIPFAYTLTSDIYQFYAPQAGMITEKTKAELNVTGFPASGIEEDKLLLSSVLQ